jgi:hypothetical protein
MARSFTVVARNWPSCCGLYNFNMFIYGVALRDVFGVIGVSLSEVMTHDVIKQARSKRPRLSERLASFCKLAIVDVVP